MSLIVNPCENCVFYREQITDRVARLVQGDVEAYKSIKTILNFVVKNEKDPEIEAHLRSHPKACTDGNSRVFCVYNRQRVESLLNEVDEALTTLRMVSPGFRRPYLQKEAIRSFVDAYNSLTSS